MNVGEIGVVAAELMDRLAADYENRESVELGVVAVIAEVSWRSGDDEITAVEYRCSDGRRWIQSGLFAAAGRVVIATSEDEEE